MKISHECPLDLLEKSKQFNDYEYSLLHLMHIPEYKEFYKAQAKKRYQILDNSAFEYQFIDGGFNIDYFIDIINEIQPSSIIIPDIISNYEATIDEFRDFPFEYLHYTPEIIGVVQGKTEDELLKCAKFMHERADKLAIVFHSPAYQIDLNKNKDENNCIGRYNIVKKIKKITNKPLHLLGCSLPKEFSLYEKGIIDTIDTANPIQFSALGIKYNDISSINNKPNYLMSEENIIKKTKNINDIYYNITKFKDLIKG